MIFVYFALGLIAVLLIVGFVMPSRYSFTRNITIAAPPASIHAFVGDLEKWPVWMPWEKKDPSVITKRSDQTTGVGASQSWTSSKSGDGEVEFTEWNEDTGIAYDMTFLSKGKRSPAKASIRYAPADGGTKVTWSMEGDLATMMPPVIRGLMKPVMSIMISKNFSAGLESLKTEVEAA
ncbi:MAG: SRPBCC family protein [Planctomycetota bacterium]